jgi:hypothetical protein
MKKTTVPRRTKSSAVSHPKLDLAAARAFASLHLPGVAVAEKFGNASFSIAGKVFAFTRPDGLVLKLPPESLARLFATREATPLIMGKRTMREWAHLHLSNVEDYRKELSLLRVSMSFVNIKRATRLD